MTSPNGWVASEDPAEQNKMLDAGLDHSAAQLHGQILYRKTLSQGKDVGREQAVEFKPGRLDHTGQPVVGIAVTRAYFLRGGMVVLVVVSDKKFWRLPKIETRRARFFDSFKPE